MSYNTLTFLVFSYTSHNSNTLLQLKNKNCRPLAHVISLTGQSHLHTVVQHGVGEGQCPRALAKRGRRASKNDKN